MYACTRAVRSGRLVQSQGAGLETAQPGASGLLLGGNQHPASSQQQSDLPFEAHSSQRDRTQLMS